MKKYFIFLTAFIYSLSCASQTMDTVAGFRSNGLLKKLYYTHYTVPNTANGYFNNYGNFVNFNTDSIAAGSTNLWFTNALARAAISLTTTGISGAATYSGGVLNIPQYAGTTYTGTTNRITITSGVIDISASYVGQSSINTLGTIGTGTWNATKLSEVYGGTNQATYTTGDLLYASGTNTLSKLPIGSSTQVLTVTGGVPVWAAAGGGSGWGTTGNAGLTAGTNFLGTTDNVNLMFKRNGLPSGLIDSLTATTGRTFFGAGAGATTTVSNTAFGFHALMAATTGNANVAIGNLALSLITTGGNSTAVGDQALKNNTGNSNTAVGSGSMITNGAGIQNTGIGANALATNSGNSNSTAVGYNALTLSTGQQNTALGSGAFAALTSATLSTAVGFNAFTATTGAQNTGVGAQVGSSLGASANGNTLVGVQAGTQLPGASSYNTFVGGEYNFNKGITSASSGNTIIGANYVSPNTSLTNTVILTEGTNGIPRFYSNNSNQTGIWSANPNALLHLGPGSTAAGQAPLKFSYSNLTTTAASGTGAKATLTFAAQTVPPFSAGNVITVTGVTPSGYNGTNQVVTACTTTTVTFTNTTTGVQTVAGAITAGALNTTPEAQALETNGMRVTFTGSDGVRGVVSLTFTGTAAPATTPSAVGDHFVDTTNKKEYVATGTSSSSDWTILN